MSRCGRGSHPPALDPGLSSAPAGGTVPSLPPPPASEFGAISFFYTMLACVPFIREPSLCSVRSSEETLENTEKHEKGEPAPMCICSACGEGPPDRVWDLSKWTQQ